jgi:NADH-quinone oxidoreductase subunit G
MGAVEGAGLLEIPAATNGRGLREAGVLPNAGAGLAEPPGGVGGDARDARAIAEGLAGGELSALYLLHSDPLRELPDGELWERALARTGTVVTHAAFLTDAVREHADVVFPAEAYAEKEGTIVHPDGRLQRLRPAIARPGRVRAEWQVLAELALRLGLDLDVRSAPMVSARLFEAVPFYAGLTLEQIGGRGVRWQERPAASEFPAPAAEPSLAPGVATVPPNAGELAGYRSIWDAPEVEFSPSLEFLFPDKARLARDKRQPEQERLQDVALEAAAGLNALRR